VTRFCGLWRGAKRLEKIEEELSAKPKKLGIFLGTDDLLGYLKLLLIKEKGQ